MTVSICRATFTKNSSHSLSCWLCSGVSETASSPSSHLRNSLRNFIFQYSSSNYHQRRATTLTLGGFPSRSQYTHPRSLLVKFGSISPLHLLTSISIQFNPSCCNTLWLVPCATVPIIFLSSGAVGLVRTFNAAVVI